MIEAEILRYNGLRATLVYRYIKRISALAIGLLCVPSAFADDVTLRFTVWDGDESLKVLRRVIGDFEKENPGIKVKLETIPDYQTYHQKMLTQYAAKVAPDVAMMDPGHFQALAKRKALLPLNEFFDKTPGFDIKTYYKAIVDAHSYKGTCYVLPRDIAPMGLIYYNKKAFDEAKMPYPDGTWTWDFKVRPELKEKDFVWVCEQLTKRDAKGKPTRWAFASGWPQLLATTFAYSVGGRYANNDEQPTKVLTTDPKFVQAYQFAADFMNKMKYMPNSTDTGTLSQTTQQLFASQKIAMYQNGIWEVPNMRKTLAPGSKEFFDWDICLFPGHVKYGKAAPTGGSGYAIFSSTPHPEEAWKLTRYMAGPAGMEAMAKAGIAQPAIRELALKPGIWVPGPDTPKEQQYPHNRIATDQAVNTVVFGPNADYWPTVETRMNSGLDLLWNGQSTAQQALSQGNARAQERLDTMLKEEKLPPFNWAIGITAGLLIVAGILGWVYFPERKIKYSNRDKIESRTGYKFALPWIIGMLVFTLGPMVFSLLMSFADWDIIMSAKWRGFGNYVEAGGTDPVFWKSMSVTTIYTVLSVPLGLFFSLMLALLLNQKVNGVPLFRSMYYVPSLASAVAAALIWRRVLNPETGLLNAMLYKVEAVGNALSNWAGTPGEPVNWLGNEKTALPGLIIMSVWGAGGAMVILLAGLQGIPQYYYEAATLDGAGIFQRFKRITLPLLTPSLFFTLITGFIGSFQSFTQALVMTDGGPNDSTRFYVFNLWDAAFRQLRMGYAASLAWILFAVILVVTLIQMKGSKWVYYEADVKG
ncbi:MAG TPA: extracellular solute-binding protein [Fimbriimonas sp.]|nr:extracellular solute-binding protein [Fimbriimonas sp.]